MKKIVYAMLFSGLIFSTTIVKASHITHRTGEKEVKAYVDGKHRVKCVGVGTWTCVIYDDIEVQ